MRTPDNVKPERCYYIDWLRVLGMLVVFLFHSARFFDSIGWHVKNGQQHIGFDVFIAFCGGWIMPLFFLISGGSTFYALQRRSGRQYTGERFRRLVIPYLMGVLILVPKQTGKYDIHLEVKMPFTEKFNSYNGSPFHVNLAFGYRF
jgi:peptidoglycan/LPS O-acetylase OafA/YrhL